MMYVAFPFVIDQLGRVASAPSYADYIVDLIEQVLFTNPGERVNRPDFGCGALRLVFETENSVMAMSACAIFQGALERWLGDLIDVIGVEAAIVSSQLTISVEYTIISSGARNVAEFQRSA